MTVETTLHHLNQNSVGAGITGFILILFTGSGFFSALDRAYTRLWDEVYLSDDRRGLVSSAQAVILKKLTAFALTVSSALLVLLSQAFSFVLQLILGFIKNVDGVIPFVDFNELLLYSSIEFLVTVALLTAVLMILFRYLPPVSLQWRDVMLGAFITALSFQVLEILTNKSAIHLGSTYLSYGVVGGVMVLLFWLFMVCQIFLLGNVISFVYAHQLGSYSNPRSCE